MIHQVIAPDQDRKLLRHLVDLQHELLEVAILYNDLDSNIDKLEHSLQLFYSDKKQGADVANWLKRGRKSKDGKVQKRKLFELLKRFACHKIKDEKREFVDQIKADITLLDAPKAMKFQVSIDKNSPKMQKNAKDFLVEFYTIFGTESGFPKILFKGHNNFEKYRRWDFINNFTSANPNLRLCAVCDSTLYRASFSDRPYTSIEHFFPKSRYPHLAIHPLNLIPICPSCNSGAAGATDPFDTDPSGLMGLILPYQQLKGLRDQTYVVVSTEDDRNHHPFMLDVLPNTDYPNSRILFENFERIYRVKERWNEEIEWLDNHVFRRITQFLMGDAQSGNRFSDVDFLISRLKVLMAVISKDALGQDPFGYVTIWLINYHVDCLTKERNNASIYQPLVGWATQQEDRWDAYLEHADEIRKTIPRS